MTIRLIIHESDVSEIHVDRRQQGVILVVCPRGRGTDVYRAILDVQAERLLGEMEPAGRPA